MTATALIDAHCHLDFEAFDDDRSEVLQRAINNNISDIVIPGTERKHWNRIKQLCANNPHLHACYGLHPYWINNKNTQDLNALDSYIETSHPVALGECGLDFRPQQADHKAQLLFFEAQLAIAENHCLPVVIHSVKATETVIKTIKKYNSLSGMIHSYSGSSEQARQLIDLNFYISLGGNITYNNANKIRKVAKDTPLSSLLLETDSPDQPDQKHSGKRNEPAYLINTLNVISELRGEPLETIARLTTDNAKALFKI